MRSNMQHSPYRTAANLVLTGAAALSLAGCATLPSSGPTASQIQKSARDPERPLDFKLVELTGLSSLPAASIQPVLATAETVAPPTDLIGPGDLLQIDIYEAGVTLFGSSGAKSVAAGAEAPPSVGTETLPAIRVDDQGRIRIPYAGEIIAAGRTTAELENDIRRALRGMSQNPQILVTIREAINNSIIIGGEVGRPGRLVLPTNRETLSDVIALAGGYRGEAKDMSVRLQRRDEKVEYRLSNIIGGADGEAQVRPGDRISIVRAPLTFSVMGAPGRVEQMPFSGPAISLAEAVAMAGGANPNLGDPQAIFVFRFAYDAQGKEIPTVYHLDMMKAGGYFISQRFAMQDKDILYIGNARANQPSKLIQVISQLFAPIVTVNNIARTGN